MSDQMLACYARVSLPPVMNEPVHYHPGKVWRGTMSEPKLNVTTTVLQMLSRTVEEYGIAIAELETFADILEVQINVPGSDLDVAPRTNSEPYPTTLATAVAQLGYILTRIQDLSLRYRGIVGTLVGLTEVQDG